MRQLAVLFLLSAFGAAQKPAPIPDTKVPQRTEILSNKRVTASRLDLAPGEATPMHQHAHDVLEVFLTSGPTRNIVYGLPAPAAEVVRAGEVRFRGAGHAHEVRNDSKTPFREVVLDFADPQGRVEQAIPKTSRYCNPGSATACVTETMLFCTAKVCVEDVTMAPAAFTTRHSHTTDHMLVAVSDYQLTDQIDGKPDPVVRSKKSGEVEYIPAGITHKLSNTGKAPARFIVILWQ
jgi:quercetin dioxygenase-like cupin family protein